VAIVYRHVVVKSFSALLKYYADLTAVWNRIVKCVCCGVSSDHHRCLVHFEE